MLGPKMSEITPLRSLSVVRAIENEILGNSTELIAGRPANRGPFRLPRRMGLPNDPDLVRALPQSRLRKTHDQSPHIQIGPRDRLVILSDFHVGDNSRRDVFRYAATTTMQALEFYRSRGYRIVLNGDIEELQNFSLDAVMKGWPLFFDFLDSLDRDGQLIKILGNHDCSLRNSHSQYPLRTPLHDGIRLGTKWGEFFVFHGHQAGFLSERVLELLGLFVRYVACPMGIENKAASPHREVELFLERRVYDFAREKGIAAIIGHTHRPLFGSLSSVESIGYRLASLARHTQGQGRRRFKSRREWRELTAQFVKAKQRELERERADRNQIVPCLYNSGCAISPRGITAIELDGDHLGLVRWAGRKDVRREWVATSSLEDVFAAIPS